MTGEASTLPTITGLHCALSSTDLVNFGPLSVTFEETLGTSMYTVGLFALADMSNPIVLAQTASSPASLAVPPTLPPGSYAVTVMSDDGMLAGATSPPAAIDRLQPPAGLSGSYRTGPGGPAVALSWQAVAGANVYAVGVTGSGIQPRAGCSSLTNETEFQFDGGLSASFIAGGSGQVAVTAVANQGDAFPSPVATAAVAGIPASGVAPLPPVIARIGCARADFGSPGQLQVTVDPWGSLLPDGDPAPRPTSYSIGLFSAGDTTNAVVTTESDSPLGFIMLPSTLPSGPYVAIVRGKSGAVASAASAQRPISRLPAPVFTATSMTGAGTSSAACSATWQAVDGAEFYQAELIVVTTSGSNATLQEPSQQLTASFPLSEVDASSIQHILILVQAVTQTGAYIASPLAVTTVD